MLLQNVLYFVLFLAIANVLGYLVMGQITAAIFFILLAFLLYNFSKNMIIVLGIALILTNVLMVGNTPQIFGNIFKEGMEDMKDMEDKDNEDSKKMTKTNNNNIMTPEDNDITMQTSGVSTSSYSENGQNNGEEEESPVNSKDAFSGVNKKRSRIDYATTLEDAYGDLNNILGSDSIKNLTGDTQRLMQQQLQLADAMKSMTPLLENAKSMLQGFDLKNIDGLADFAKSFAPSK